jgi:transcriptional regulator with XRE-family HTH domain
MPALPELKRLRLRRGLTQRALAEQAGVALRTVISLEHAKEARLETVFKLASCLDVEPIELIVRNE